jgi:hypothetical protein
MKVYRTHPCRFLARFKRVFKSVDTGGVGVLDTKRQFRQLVRELGLPSVRGHPSASIDEEDAIDALALAADPHHTGRVTFSDCVSALATDLAALLKHEQHLKQQHESYHYAEQAVGVPAAGGFSWQAAHQHHTSSPAGTASAGAAGDAHGASMGGPSSSRRVASSLLGHPTGLPPPRSELLANPDGLVPPLGLHSKLALSSSAVTVEAANGRGLGSAAGLGRSGGGSKGSRASMPALKSTSLRPGGAR